MLKFIHLRAGPQLAVCGGKFTSLTDDPKLVTCTFCLRRMLLRKG